VKQETNEQSLLQGLASSDKKAVETIYRDNFSVIQSLIINNNGSSDDAKDLFQEALIVLYEKLKSGNFELNCQIKTYLYSVCKRLWLKRLQQMGRVLTSSNGLENTIPVENDLEEYGRRDHEFEVMNKAMGHLGEPCKSLLEAYYLQKKNMHDIAADFGYTNADNAKNQKYKCLVRLKKIFFTHYNNQAEDER
jgi:RNA polymerase sigma factor (sigma-70 family)